MEEMETLQRKEEENPKLVRKIRNETLEDKLDRIETEVKNYEEELEQKKHQEKIKEDRLARKRKLERHWEMLRWIVSFLDENEDKWSEMRRERAREEEEKIKINNWETKTREQNLQNKTY